MTGSNQSKAEGAIEESIRAFETVRPFALYATASSEQVRQPIFREGLFQWRNYEPWLGPLKDGLGDALTRYRE